MSRSFPNTTDFLRKLSFTTPTTAMSICFWVKNPNINDFYTYIRNDSVAYQLAGSSTGTGRIEFTRGWTTPGVWRIDSAVHGMTFANWNHQAWTYNGASTANDALFYANGVAKTVTRGTAPVGSINNTQGNLYIGRWENASRNIGGSMAYVCVHNVVLTQGEVLRAMKHGYTPRGLVGFWDLPGIPTTERDLSGGRQGMAVTGTTITNGPPVRPRLIGAFA